MPRIARGTDAPMMTVADIAREKGLDPQRARAVLRKYNLSGQRVKPDSKTLKVIEAILEIDSPSSPERAA